MTGGRASDTARSQAYWAELTSHVFLLSVAVMCVVTFCYSKWFWV